MWNTIAACKIYVLDMPIRNLLHLVCWSSEPINIWFPLLLAHNLNCHTLIRYFQHINSALLSLCQSKSLPENCFKIEFETTKASFLLSWRAANCQFKNDIQMLIADVSRAVKQLHKSAIRLHNLYLKFLEKLS